MRHIVIICLSLLLLQASGCGSELKTEELMAAGPNPVIGNITFLGQSPKSAEVLVFSLDFVDEDGDLGDGEIEVFINNELVGGEKVPLRPTFLIAQLDPRDKKGTFQIVVQIFFSKAGSLPTSSLFEVSVRVKDKAGHLSEKQSILMSVKNSS